MRWGSRERWPTASSSAMKDAFSRKAPADTLQAADERTRSEQGVVDRLTTLILIGGPGLAPVVASRGTASFGARKERQWTRLSERIDKDRQTSSSGMPGSPIG